MSGRFFINGGAGCIGLHLTNDLLRQGHRVRALDGTDVVYHFAARVGVGRSTYEIADYVSVNNEGTAQLLQALIENPVERLIIASSMSIDRKGIYRDTRGALVSGNEREQFRETDLTELPGSAEDQIPIDRQSDARVESEMRGPTA